MYSITEIIEVVESRTGYDILNWSEFSIDVINRFGWDDETTEISIYNKSIEEIIKAIKNI